MHSPYQVPLLTLLFVLLLAGCAPAPAAPTGAEPASDALAAPAEAAAVAEPLAQKTVPLELAADQIGAGPRIVYLHPEFPFTLDPQNTSAFAGALALQFWDTLVSYEIDFDTGIADQTLIISRLAESWEISDDQKVLTFHLRQDATFWDGTPVTAEDVYWSIERAIKGRMGWGATQIETGGIYDVEQMEVVDPHTFRVTYPDGMGRYSLRNFASMSLTVLSKQACEAANSEADPWCVEWIKRNAMGSGPYMLGDFSPGEFLIAKANTNYWGEPKPYFAEIMFRVVPDPQTRMLLLQSGEADIGFLSPKEYSALAGDPTVTVFSIPRGQDVAVMRWKPTVPPFDDIKIREAIIKAIPYDRIVADVCLGFCTPVKNFVGVSTPGYDEEPLFTTDIEAAKQLIAESSYAGNVPSFEVPLNQESFHMNSAVVIQDALRQVGIDMQIKPITGTAFDELAWDKRALEVSLHSMGPWWNDFMYWAYWMYRTDSATNHIQYSNAMLDENVLQALLVPQNQVDAYMELQEPVLELLIDERLAAPLYQVNWSVVHSKRLCNINTFPWGQIAIQYLRECE